MRVLLVLPNQLFNPHPGLTNRPDRILLIEDSLFFSDPVYPARHHKQKLWLHRTSMRNYRQWLEDGGQTVDYVSFDSTAPQRLDQRLVEYFDNHDVSELEALDPVDFIATKRLRSACKSCSVELSLLDTPGFINTPAENAEYASGRKRWFMADFYRWQRIRMGILVDEQDNPEGGKWSFDTENRKKIPKRLEASIPGFPKCSFGETEHTVQEEIQSSFTEHPGSVDELFYPTTHAEAEDWLDEFLRERFENFGIYEDAIVQGQSMLWHSVLTPMLNIGLLTPRQIVDRTLKAAEELDTPLNSLEGFIRQIIGWREFMRATYEDLGVKMRTTNHWGHTRALPNALYDGTTGVDPIDDTINRIVQTGYCHHIERLMVLGGFMFLCEIDPDEIYRWFMEMFVDSYDWVMVPNVYAMSQNADGGLITTKPYFSGSAYVKRMSNYRKGPWCDIWDGLYWRWIDLHQETLSSNPRWSMMCAMVRKMDAQKLAAHHQAAETFLEGL
ncbi:MAG TPA: cryptochrome/photolyase family protein [Planctomycetaceae bacterium]|nr:cryptochrome/photolyase family protein [Planctomycetaceae bacterium]